MSARSLFNSLPAVLLILIVQTLGAQSPLWEELPMKPAGPAYFFFNDPVQNRLILGGEFYKVDGKQVALATLDSTDQTDSMAYIPISVSNTRAMTWWKGHYFVGGNGLFVDSADKWSQLSEWANTFERLLPEEDTLFVAGFYDNLGPHMARTLAACDSNLRCTTLGNLDSILGPNDHISALARYKGMLVAGGNFNRGNAFKEIMQWDGSRWLPMDNGIVGGGDDWVTDMVVYHNELYVAGRFFKALGAAGDHIMKWDGEKWSQVGGGIKGVMIYDLHIFQDQLWAGGIIDSADGKPAHRIARWDGNQWHSLGSVFDGERVIAIGDFNNRLYISGGFKEIDGQSFLFHARLKDSTQYRSVGWKQPETNTRVQVRPNPSSGQFFIEGLITPVSYILQNSEGKQIKEGYYHPGSTLELTDLIPGIYLLKITDAENLSFTLRLIIQ